MGKECRCKELCKGTEPGHLTVLHICEDHSSLSWTESRCSGTPKASVSNSGSMLIKNTIHWFGINCMSLSSRGDKQHEGHASEGSLLLCHGCHSASEKEALGASFSLPSVCCYPAVQPAKNCYQGHHQLHLWCVCAPTGCIYKQLQKWLLP